MSVLYDYGVSEEEFEEAAIKAKKKINRVCDVEVDTDRALVFGKYITQNGNSIYSFCLDFNDGGHFTALYDIADADTDSDLPRKVGDVIESQLRPKISIPYNAYFKSHNKISFKAILIIIAVVALLFSVAFIGGKLYLTAEISVGTSSKKIIGKDYKKAVETIKDAGFIEELMDVRPVYDVDIHNEDQIYTVATVSIHGEEKFSSKETFPRNSKVILEYHDYKRIEFPYSPSEVKKMTCNQLVVELTNLGYINVSSEPLNDLVLSDKKDRYIKEITINGDKKYSKDASYRADAEIVIKYHSPME